MSISMQCGCSRSFKIKDELAGKKIRCPECRAVLAVPKPEVVLESDDDANFLAEESPPVTVTPIDSGRPRSRKSRDDDEDDWRDDDNEDDAPRPKKKKSRDDGFTADPAPWDKAKPKPRKEKSPKKKPRSLNSYDNSPPERSGPGIVISRTIIAGILMMVGAVVWFGLGLAAGLIFYYPPILFLCGMGTVLKGALGHED